MGSSTSKKVLVQRFDREPMSGFVNPRAWLRSDSAEVLSTSGTLSLIPYSEIKLVSFVREFDPDSDPMERRSFQNRPKTEGLWIRMEFRDGDTLEGLHANNLLSVEAPGFMVTPPDPSGFHQRIFVPRAALKEVHVLGVIGSALRRTRKKALAREQLEMFEK